MENKKTYHANNKYIEGIAASDTGIIREVYQQFFSRILHLIQTNSGSKEDAEDVFEEALIIIYKKAEAGKLQLKCSFYTYLYAVCRLVWLRNIKKSRRSLITFEDITGYKDVADTESIEEDVIEKEREALYIAMFRKLSQDCQKVIKLFYEGHSLKEIGEVMGHKASYIKLKKFRCRDKLFDLIKNSAIYKELI